MEKDKILPHIPELEADVIGSILNVPGVMGDVVEFLTAPMFYDQKNQIIYRACVSLYKENAPINLLSVTNLLREQKLLDSCGGAACVTEISSNNHAFTDTEYYARIIQEKYILRKINQVGSELYQKSYTEDCFDLLEFAEKEIFNLSRESITVKEKLIGQLNNEQIEDFQNKKNNNVVGLLTGLKAIDFILQGIKNQNVVTVAGGTSMGKTALAMTMARNMVMDYNIPCVFFSMEMSEKELCKRFTAINSGIPMNYVINLDLTDSMFEKVMQDKPRVDKAPLVIDGTPGQTVMSLRTHLRKYIIAYGIKCAFIDYLQLMESDSNKGTRESQVSQLSRGVKRIAKEMDIPIFDLSQLSRKVDERPDHRPKLSDLRESGSIEQDSDIVILVYRPEYYEIDVNEKGEVLSPGYSEAIIQKHRNGPLGTAKLKFVKELTKFEDANTYAEYIPDKKDPF